MILDTSAISDLLRGVDQIRAIVEDCLELAFPVVVIGEYQYGLRKSPQRDRLEPLFRGLLATGRLLDVTLPTAMHYGNIAAEQDRLGRPIPQNDIWIAALARQYGLPVVSRDTHFDRVEGLRRIGW